MEIDFSIVGKVVFSMINYIDKMLKELPLDMVGLAATPAASNLFDVQSETTKLDIKESEFFHHNVAK